jgi:hypothetical protein
MLYDTCTLSGSTSDGFTEATTEVKVAKVSQKQKKRDRQALRGKGICQVCYVSALHVDWLHSRYACVLMGLRSPLLCSSRRAS